MKKTILGLILFTIVCNLGAQEKGDSLAILYRRVYAYTAPGDLSTRYNKIPFSYFNENKLIFIAQTDKYPKYYQAKTVKGDTLFVKAELVSFDQHLTHAQIMQDIKDGKRKRSPGEIADLTKWLPDWAFWLIWIALTYLLYRFWKRYDKFDSWFCKKARYRKAPLKNAWFIKFATLAGVLFGSVQLFAKHEFKWFLQEGFQVWGSYPNKWDWVMWGASVAFILIVITAIAQSFSRFKLTYAVIYAILALLFCSIYFSIGLALSVFIIIIYAITHARGSGGSGGSGNSSGSGGSYNSGSSNSSNTYTKEEKVTRVLDDNYNEWEQNSSGDWERTQKW